jgi:hypothetical protein
MMSPQLYAESIPLSPTRSSGIQSVNLPFIIRIVRTEEHLSKAVDVRAETYRKHHPELASQLSNAEAADRAPFSLVLLAEAKQDGAAIGTMRIETNVSSPLNVESLIPTSSGLNNKTLAFVTRLGIRKRDDSQLIKVALFKALHRYCLACQIDSMVVTAKPPMDRQYVKLGFKDLYEPNKLIPIPWSNGIATRLLALETFRAEQDWRATDHPLYKFMIEDFCPDIQIFASVSGIWSRPRGGRGELPSQEVLKSVFGDAYA